jgi:pSer/pThr/pTyr-binding forkhead associated (FHA) protein
MPEGFTLSAKDKSSYVIGSAEDCDIILRHPTIEPLHCGIILEKGSVKVWDLGANSGVKINGTRVTEENLKVGDVMTLGALDLHVRFQLRRPNLKPKPETPGAKPGTGPIAAPLPVGPPSKEIPKGPITYAKVTKQIKDAGKPQSFFQKLFGKKTK